MNTQIWLDNEGKHKNGFTGFCPVCQARLYTDGRDWRCPLSAIQSGLLPNAEGKQTSGTGTAFNVHREYFVEDKRV